MSDARFAVLKTDPRFRRLKKHQSKVVLDDRFKDLLEGDDESKKKKKEKKRSSAKVDKYGRSLSETQEKDELRRFYRLEDDAAVTPTVVDYARGAVLMESSDEDEHEDAPAEDDDSESDQGGFVSLGVEPRSVAEDADELEIDLDEDTIATLDAQVADYAKAVPELADVSRTKRLAVVNLDWDHVRAVHLYKIFSSLVSPVGLHAASKSGVNVARGRILSVRVYPSEFGQKRMAKEDREGPPTEVFRRKKDKELDEEINERTLVETGDEADYDEGALRNYQLERLRYYYAIVECDTPETAAHVYDELEGTELERSANVFDLSFVPDDMAFDDEPRDEATQPSDAPYRAVEFVTDALRHSKVKLTWDDDDPERVHYLRRPLTKNEIDEADFRAYIASSSSEGEDEDEASKTSGRVDGKTQKKAERDRLRTLLLGGNDDEMPEEWGNVFDNKASRVEKGGKGKGQDVDVDMEVTFTPGLSESKNPEDENTLERYQRKMKEKRKRKKGETKKREGVNDGGDSDSKKDAKSNLDDEFFGVESDNDREEVASSLTRKGPTKQHAELSKAELALLAASDNPRGEPAHFDMKVILKAEKQAKGKNKHKKRQRENDEDDGPGETQDDFVMDVKDDRFAAIHEDHQFAIDPTNPRFKKTKSMSALLNERSKRQKDSRSGGQVPSRSTVQQGGRSLKSLVESVKRKSVVSDDKLGKRRRGESRHAD